MFIPEREVRMGCQASREENTESWEGSQDLLGAGLILDLPMMMMGPGQFGLSGWM